MRKSFKYRVYANNQTISNAERWLVSCRELYNACLAERKYAYKMHNISLNYFDQQRELPEVKRAIPDLKNIDSQVLSQVLIRLDRSFKAFFKRCKSSNKVGYPRFMGKNRYNSFTLVQHSWKLNGCYLTIKNLGIFKIKLSRGIQGNIKTIDIKRNATNKWFVCFNCDNVPEKTLLSKNNIIGLDVGIKSFLTDSEGNKITNPKFFHYGLKELRVINRRLSRTKLKSNRHKKVRFQFAKLYERICNQRRDFQHKLANQYIKSYGVIAHEDIRINNFKKNIRVSKSIMDCGWGQFFEILNYKAEEAGRIIVKVNPKNTSKVCSECGAINKELKLSEKQWVCQSCGILHDRDINAALNLKRFGQNHQTLTKEVALNVV